MRAIRKFRPLRAIRNAIRTDDEGVPNQFDLSFFKEAKYFSSIGRGDVVSEIARDFLRVVRS